MSRTRGSSPASTARLVRPPRRRRSRSRWPTSAWSRSVRGRAGQPPPVAPRAAAAASPSTPRRWPRCAPRRPRPRRPPRRRARPRTAAARRGSSRCRRSGRGSSARRRARPPPSRRTPRRAPRRPAARRRSAATTCRSTARSAAVTTSVAVLLVLHVGDRLGAHPAGRRRPPSRAIRTAIASSSPVVDVARSSSRDPPFPPVPFSRSTLAASSATPRPCRGVLRREDLGADGATIHACPPLHGHPPAAGPRHGGSHTTPASLVRPRAAPGHRPCSLIASGRSFVTEAHQTGADVRSLTDALIAHARPPAASSPRPRSRRRSRPPR